MRIVGGKYKGRKLTAPEGRDTRPTSDRARESIFNILEHQSWGRSALRGGRVLDVFCGTGALGIEAYSRGAEHVTFMDKDETAMKCLMQNLKGLGDRTQIHTMRVDATAPTTAQNPCSLIFMDAPYKSGLNDLAIAALKARGWVTDKTLFVVEVSRKENWITPDGFEELDRRKYGAAQVIFFQA
ncbi:16S rRNA (guanine(966)-N(2))-methyltransferase RsmD [Terasakiella pusilla]|uniref:16S rRNA (guanine(966)-N(2))-methyltransferase RsmD n=1 Tax=Terasakiella pusilla TaxID=64973 RepID=UPI003AA8B38D